MTRRSMPFTHQQTGRQSAASFAVIAFLGLLSTAAPAQIGSHPSVIVNPQAIYGGSVPGAGYGQGVGAIATLPPGLRYAPAPHVGLRPLRIPNLQGAPAAGFGVPLRPQPGFAAAAPGAPAFAPRPNYAATRPAPAVSAPTPPVSVARATSPIAPAPAPAVAPPPPVAPTRSAAVTAPAARPAPPPAQPAPVVRSVAPPPPPPPTTTARQPAAASTPPSAPATTATPPPPPPRRTQVASTTPPTAPAASASTGTAAVRSVAPPPPAAPRQPVVEPARPTRSAAPVKQAALPDANSQLVSIGFQPGSTGISAGDKKQLEALSGRLKDTQARLRLRAYASAQGESVSRARRTSLKRALEVRLLLIEYGMRSTRIDVRALGEANDGGPEDRVDIVLIGK